MQRSIIVWQKRCFLLLGLAMAGMMPAHAQLLVGTTLPTSGPGLELGVTDSQFLAQNFTLLTGVDVSSVTVDMSGFGVDPLMLWITNAVGPSATTGNVLFETTLTFPNTGGGVNSTPIAITPTGLFLPTGSYYLVENSTQTVSSQGWVGGTAIPTSFGSVGQGLIAGAGSTNAAFPYDSTFGPGFGTVAFQVSGTTVPEPQTLLFSLLGLATILALKAWIPGRLRSER